MGLFGAILERRASDQGSLRNPTPWMIDAFGGGSSAAGVRVTLDSARTLSVVWACLRVISDDIAKLPLKVYRQAGTAREEVSAHPINRLLNRKPNGRTIAVTFRQALQLHAMTGGGGFAEIQRTNGGEVIALHPLHRRRVTVENDGAELRYRVTNPDREDSVLRADQMLHIRGMGDDGVVGQSVIGFARDSMGMSLAAQQYGGQFMQRGMRPVGILKTAAKLNDVAVQNLRNSMEELYGGPKNAGKVPIFDQGLEWQNVSIAPKDAEFLETKKHTALEVCQWFRCPPHKIFDMAGVNNSSLEQMQMAYVSDSLGFWFQSWEQELYDKLLTEDEKADHYFKHNADAMQRGDSKSRNEGYAIARTNGWMNGNEIRAKEDLAPIEGGDKYLAPVNMTTLDKVGQTPTPPADPKTPAPTPTNGNPGPMVDPNARSLEQVAGTIEKIVMASRDALTEAIRRVLHTEADKAGRAIKRGDLKAWVDEFYRTHGDFVRAAVFPVIDSIVGSVRAAIDPDGWQDAPAWAAHAVAVWHVETSRSALAVAPAPKLGEWTDTRAAADADRYLAQITGKLTDDWRRSHGGRKG